MNKIIKTLLSCSLFTMSVLANTNCTSVATATVENIASCPENIYEAIYKSGTPVDLAALEGKAFRTNSFYYAYIKKGKVLLNSIRGTKDSSYDSGLFALLVREEEATIAWKKESIENTRMWNGIFLKRDRLGNIIFRQVYPLDSAVLLTTINDEEKLSYEKVDALAAYLPLISSNNEKVLFLMDFIRMPEIASSTELSGLAKYLAAFRDSRISNVFLELLSDETVSEKSKSEIVKAAVDNSLLTQDMTNQIIQDIGEVQDKTCNSIYLRTAMSSITSDSTNFRNAIYSYIKNCNSEANYSIEGMQVAVNVSSKFKMKSSVLGIMDFLNIRLPAHLAHPTPSNQRTWTDEYEDLLTSAMSFLGMMRAVPALTVLNNDIYYNSAYPRIAKAARNAVNQITVGQNISKIKAADKAKIDWGMYQIENFDGSKRDIQFEILGAFEEAMKKSPAQKLRIKDFLKKVLAEGYHEQDLELTKRMRELSVK